MRSESVRISIPYLEGAYDAQILVKEASMAELERVESIFKMRLGEDSTTQLEEAGLLWKSLPLFFYYTKEGQPQINIAVVEVTKQVADEDGITIPDFVYENLQDMVHPSTLTADAARAIWLATFQP